MCTLFGSVDISPIPCARAYPVPLNHFQVGGMGLGDGIMTALATVLPILRNVERLVAFDNRTTDPGTHIIVKAVQGMPCLTYLGKTRRYQESNVRQRHDSSYRQLLPSTVKAVRCGDRREVRSKPYSMENAFMPYIILLPYSRLHARGGYRQYREYHTERKTAGMKNGLHSLPGVLSCKLTQYQRDRCYHGCSSWC